MMKVILSAIVATIIATPAFAHPPAGAYGSFAAGVSHPLLGLDHILAMVVVGLWAACLGGNARWYVPSAFVGTMIVGFALALASVPLPMVEPMILASTIVLGLLVAMAVKLDVGICAVIVGLFALFHGHAHGGELGEAGVLQFGVGFALATVALHGVGLGLGGLLGAKSKQAGQTGTMITRLFGAGAALAGLGLFVGF